MKKATLLFTCLMFIFTYTSYSKPMIQVVDGNTMDWGKVSPSQSPLKTVIKITNIGDGVLVVDNVKATCGCTTTSDYQKELKAGDTAFVDVKLNVSSRGGSVHKAIKIYSNDEATPMLRYSLKAEVVTPLMATPRYLRFRGMNVGEPAKTQLVIKNTSNKDIKIEDIEMTPKNMVLSVRKGTTIKAGKEVKLDVTVVPEEAGSFRCSIDLKTDCKEQKSLKFSGYGKVAGNPILLDEQK